MLPITTHKAALCQGCVMTTIDNHTKLQQMRPSEFFKSNEMV